MKKLLSITFVLIISAGLTACGETKEEKIVNNMIEMTEKVGEKVTNQERETIKNALENNEEFQKEVAALSDGTITGLLKSYSGCLKDADSKSDATDCFMKTNKEAIKMGLPDEAKKFDADKEFGDWSSSKKESVLKGLAEDLKRMQNDMKSMQ